MSDGHQTIKIRRGTYRLLKRLAGETAEPLLILIDRLAQDEAARRGSGDRSVRRDTPADDVTHRGTEGSGE